LTTSNTSGMKGGNSSHNGSDLKVLPKVRPNPSPSLNYVQNMVNSALEWQAKSIDELLHRLIEEQDGKKPDATSTNPSSSTCTVVSLKRIHIQVVHWRAAHQCQTPLPADESLPQSNNHREFSS
jgi:hypothetical protein